jgi:LysR family transcriptional regulator (chromosome initiation inhibitor)
MRGCVVAALGVMRYQMTAAPAFAQRWFPHGLEREAARKAPLLIFDRKDALQSTFLLRELGLPPGSYPASYVPESAAFMHAVRLGLGYGMLPEQQIGTQIAEGALVDLAPGKWSDVPLYWHAWRVQSPKMERLSDCVVEAARKALRPPPS